MNGLFVLWATILLEIITDILRFGFNIHSKTIQEKCNLPFRIHHMYIGGIVIIIGLFFPQQLFPDIFLQGSAITILDLGLTIALSDMIHHFGILPLFHKKMDFP